MKTIILFIALCFSCCCQGLYAQLSSQNIGSATVDIGNNFSNDPISNIEKVNNGGNAKYIRNGNQIKIYVFESMPTTSNWSAYLQTIDNVRPFQTKTILGDNIFVLENHTLGKLTIDATIQNRKTLVYQENQVLVLTCELVISQPKPLHYFDFPSCGTYPTKNSYNWQTNTIDSKAFLVYQSTTQNFSNQLNKIWTDGNSAIIKAGVMTPEGGSMNIAGASVSLVNYNLIGYINLRFTGTKPSLEKVYFVKYKLENISETFILKISFITGECPDNKQPDATVLNLNPQP